MTSNRPDDALSIRRVSFASRPVQRLMSEWNTELIATDPGFHPGTGSLAEDSEFDGLRASSSSPRCPIRPLVAVGSGPNPAKSAR
jgi:hypothetical protein